MQPLVTSNRSCVISLSGSLVTCQLNACLYSLASSPTHTQQGSQPIVPACVQVKAVFQSRTGFWLLSWYWYLCLLSHGSAQSSHSVVSNSLRLHGLQHARFPCQSPTPGACSNSCPSSRWCHPTISSSVVPFSSCLQYFPASRSFPMSQFFTGG